MPTLTKPKKKVIKKRILTTPPSSWSLTTKPVVGTPGLISASDASSWDYQVLPKKYQELKTWADKNKLELSPSDFTLVRYNDWSEVFVWTSFVLTKKITPRNHRVFDSFSCTC